METYIFTDDCIIGNETIDNEHRNLFASLNKANNAALEGKANTAELAKGFLESLAEYANTHFKHEEAYMESIDDPELTVQKMEHEAFIKTISDKMDEGITDDNAAEKLEELLRFTAKWLYHHILGSDTLIGTTVKSDTDDNPFDFTDKYLTGIDSIDAQHKNLFEIIASLHDASEAAKKGFDKYDFIVETLAELKEYTETHFADEEEYMESINYKGLDAQRKAHKAFVERISKIELYELDDNQEEYLSNLTDFLITWLSQHILKMDVKIGK